MLARDARMRLAVGVLLALLVGFLPAHIISSVRESSKYTAIDEEVKAEYAQYALNPTTDAWRDLGSMRDEQRKAKVSARDGIAMTGVGVWLVSAGLLGFLWMRKLPWDRWE
jgi:hypothetical protein